MHIQEENAKDIENEENEVCTNDIQKLYEAREIPDTMVHTKNIENCDGHHNEVWHRFHIPAKIVMWNQLETEIESKI